MSRRTMRTLALAVLGFTLACQKGEKATPADTATVGGSNVDRAIAVAQAIKANPAAAESVLTANNLTAEGFDSLMYTIAADSAKAAAYTRAMQ